MTGSEGQAGIGRPATDLDIWEPLRPEAAATLFRDLPVPWWIAGGWALDLFAGRQTREHADLDIEVLRRDQFAVQRHLAGWDLHTAADGLLHPWQAGTELGAGINGVWCRPTPDAPWVLDIMFAASEGTQWCYRRHPALMRPLDAIGLRTDTGIPFVAPEIQLLFKSRARRPKDDADFALFRPLLDQARRDWLAAALHTAHPGHPWLAQL